MACLLLNFCLYKVSWLAKYIIWETAADIQQRREEREAREREEEAQKHREEARREEARRAETTHSTEEGVSEKRLRTDKSAREMDTFTDSGGVAGTFQLHSRHKKGHMTNIYLMDSDEEATGLCERPQRVV